MVDVHPPSAAAGAGGDDGEDRRPYKKQLPEPPDIAFDEEEDPQDPVWNRTASVSRSGKSALFRSRGKSRRNQSEIKATDQGQKDYEEVVIVPRKARSRTLSQVPRFPPSIEFPPEALQQGGTGKSHKLDMIRQSRKSTRKSEDVMIRDAAPAAAPDSEPPKRPRGRPRGSGRVKFLVETVPADTFPRNVQKPNPIDLAQPSSSRFRTQSRVTYNDGTKRRKTQKYEIPLLHRGLTDQTFAKLFEEGKICDLCARGPSLALGLWVNWCCGMLSSDCSCKVSAQTQVIWNFVNSSRGRAEWPQNKEPSGKLHLKCVLWCNNVKWNIMDPNDVASGRKRFFVPNLLKAALTEGHNQRDGWCASCGQIGAAISCIKAELDESERALPIGERPNKCRKQYHYPCAEQTSREKENYLRMWTGPFARNKHKIICPDHLQPIEAKEAEDERNYHQERLPEIPPYPGVNMISEDLSNGLEPIAIPVFNDIHSDPGPPPQFQYTTVCVNEQGYEVPIKPSGRENIHTKNQGCGGCAAYDNDRANEPVSPHFRLQIKNLKRYNDKRQDWQGVAMFGRLCYENNLLQLRTVHNKIDGQGAQNENSISGYFFKDVVECNLNEEQVCNCLPAACQNSVLQRGIQKRIEVYKTEHKYWGVRAAERILRGEFVAEYIGEIISEKEANKRPDSYLYVLDHHPELESAGNRWLLTIDGMNYGNVGKFINHSCTGNLEAIRVYTETLDLGYYRVGFFAAKDIRPGEELTFNYNYAYEIKPDNPERVGDDNAVRCNCKSGEKCRIWMK